MTEKIIIPVDEKLAAEIWQVFGLSMAYHALGGDKPKSALPGFHLAIALVEKTLADERANMSGDVYRAAARHGVDVAKVASIYTSIKNGKPVVEVEPADLVDQADGV